MIIIGDSIMKILTDFSDKLSRSIVGNLIRVKGHTYQVIGVYAPRSSPSIWEEDCIGLIPISRYQGDFSAEPYSLNVITVAPDAADLPKMADQGIKAMRETRGLRGDDQNDFAVCPTNLGR